MVGFLWLPSRSGELVFLHLARHAGAALEARGDLHYNLQANLWTSITRLPMRGAFAQFEWYRGQIRLFVSSFVETAAFFIVLWTKYD